MLVDGTVGCGVITQSGTTLANTYQPLDAGLTSLAGLTYAAASFVKMTGANAFALRTIGETADDLEGTIVHDNLASVHQGVATGDEPTFAGLKLESELFIKEQANADGDTTAYGQLWVKNETPNELYFTDDTGTDHKLRMSAITQTINLLQSDSSAEKQAKIDAVPRFLPPDAVVTFQFETGLTHTETTQLAFIGFYGGGVFLVQGNTAEADATILHTTQDTELDFTTNGVNGLLFNNCSVGISVKNLKITIQDSSARTAVFFIQCYGANFVLYNYLLAEGNITANYAVYNSSTFNTTVQLNYLSGMNQALVSDQSFMYSRDNDDTGTRPKYGLFARNGGVIGKRGTQPTGSTADELTQFGGVVR